ALTQLAGTAISAATTAAATLGFGTPWAVTQVATRVASLSARVGKYVTKLLKAIKELLPRLDDAARLFRSLRKALDDALASGSNAIRTATRKADDAAHALPTPSPAIRAPHAAARTADDTFLDLVESGQAYAPGYRPDYVDDLDTVITLFDTRIKNQVINSADPTLGPPGGVSFLMPSDDADLIGSMQDAVFATGHAPGVETAVRNGEKVFGLEIPAASLDLRAPTRADAKSYAHYTEGGYTATNADGLYTMNRIRELVVDGGMPMVPGTALFELLPDGSREWIGVFS
ncbi:MAG: hypothetical protein HGA51_07600, partial [Demequinaceae bacterium]|nr:hypothetical protein [Demequinaceae bacterium]